MTLRGRGWVLPGLEGAEAGAAPCRLNGSLRMGGVLESACRALGGWQDPWLIFHPMFWAGATEHGYIQSPQLPAHIPQSSRVPSLPTTLSCQPLLQSLGGEGGHPRHSPLPRASTTFSSRATPLPWPLGSFGGWVGALLFCFN